MMAEQLTEKMAQWKEKTAEFMGREFAFTKLDFYLLGAVLFLAGVCVGLLAAPWTQGVSIGSNNGSYNGNGGASRDEAEEEEDFED